MNETTQPADPAQYWQSQQHAVAELAAQLRAGDETAEPAFIAAFTGLADHLLLDDPAAFIALVDSTRDTPLAAVGGRQLRRFYQGLALGLSDRYTDALAVFDALLAEADLDEQVRGRTLNTRANYCRYTGRLEEALAGYRASLELWQCLGNRLREGIARLNLGITSYDLRAYSEAEDNLSLAVRCFDDAAVPSWLAAAHNELGLVCRDQGRWPDALAHLRNAAAHYQAQGAHDPLSRVQNNIGEVLLFQGQVTEASTAFQQALAEMHTRTYAVDAYLNLGLARQIAGDLPGALAAFHDALDLAQAIGRQDVLAHAHYRLGDALRRTGQDDEALAQFIAGVEVIEQTRAPMHDEGLKISLMGRWQQVYEALVLHCLALDRMDEAFAWAERARARAFADAVANSVNSQTNHEHGAHEPVSPVATVVATTAELQAQLPAGSAVLCYFCTGVLEQDQPLLRVLPAKSAVREHLITPARTLLFVVTGDGLTVHVCPLDPNAFASTSPRKDDYLRYLAPPVLRRLYDWLLEPARDVLPPAGVAGVGLATQTLYVIPHGPIHHIPFGALTSATGQPMTSLGGPVLTYAPSATVLLRLLQRRAASEQSSGPDDTQPATLAIGFDGADEGADSLRHTEAEAQFVAHVAHGRALIGPGSKLAELEVASRSCRQLHFACHGRFDYEQPLASYLQMGAGERLTAQQVLTDWQLPAPLVVLSACQTGISRVLRGDEPMGLVRAFLYAGARAVLVSQWPVEDLSTFLLMRRFYEVLPATPNPASALQSAQVWLRELSAAQARALAADLGIGGFPLGDGKPFADPRHWSAFIVVGAV